jgi:hypothetical protein
LLSQNLCDTDAFSTEGNVMTYNVIKFRAPTRRDRDMNRGRAEFARIRAEGGTAREAALRWIGTTFDAAGPHSRFKDGVQRLMGLGAGHDENRAKFGALARAFTDLQHIARPDFDYCLDVLDQAWRGNRAMMRRAAWRTDGAIDDHKPSALAEARLIMRLLRRTDGKWLWPMILETLAEQPERPRRTVFVAGPALEAAE